MILVNVGERQKLRAAGKHIYIHIPGKETPAYLPKLINLSKCSRLSRPYYVDGEESNLFNHGAVYFKG